ncbi:MAG: hypothetical protein JNL60_05110, partial [Bacteroidia bacterium]|nr:hypothetical protein [Bacteroidia bacterium]
MGRHLLSKFILSAAVVISSSKAFKAQSDFTWKKGPNSINQSGMYGLTMGAGNATTTPGGREGMAFWKDAAGNFWIFGGTGYDFIGNFGALGDLWKYDPTTSQWTWKKGANSITTQGTYGTMGTPAAANTPGARDGATSWTDANGNLWLFGGFGHNGTSSIGMLNDLWKYNVSTDEWTWIGGTNQFYQVSSFGTQGTPASTNIPAARQGASSWTDASGNLWLFGGYGSTGPTTLKSLNDLWKYNISTNEWTWMNGSMLGDQNGTYGTLGTGAAINTPGARSDASTWIDAAGNLWLFGGSGWDASTTTGTGLLNDLWRYKTATNEWTWVKGSNLLNQTGVYGTQGVGSLTNLPGSRTHAATWIDNAGNMWLMGGSGYPASGSAAGGLNDLWKYNMTVNQWTWMQGTTLLDMNGIYGTLNIGALTNLPGARRNYANWIDANNNLWLFGGFGKAASGGSGSLSDVWKYTNCSISPITLTVTSQDSVICAGESTTLTASGSSNYQWLNAPFPSSSVFVISPTSNITYTVRTIDGNGCRYDATFTQTV